LGQKYIDAPEMWKETEDMVRKVLQSANIPHIEVEDEAAFYGPKIDIQIWSAIGREFTLATNQVDFAQAERFDLYFINEKSEKERPLILHRAPLSTHERFIGFLLEHYAGKFPLWMSPEQVILLPISEKYQEYSEKVLNILKKHDIRALIDDRSEKTGKKIRDAELKKLPLMLIIGEKEQGDNTVTVRKQGGEDLGAMTVEAFINYVNAEIAQQLN
jgi:threonyl-tRNA synthetase